MYSLMSSHAWAIIYCLPVYNICSVWFSSEIDVQRFFVIFWSTRTSNDVQSLSDLISTKLACCPSFVASSCQKQKSCEPCRVINHFLSVEPQLSREKGNKRKSRKEMEDVAVEALALIKGGCWGFQNSSLGLGWHKVGSRGGIMCLHVYKKQGPVILFRV